MPRLPKPGGDAGSWGDLLNDFLSQEHNADGSLKRGPDIDAITPSAGEVVIGGASGDPVKQIADLYFRPTSPVTDRTYRQMPLQAQLQADLNADYAAGRLRRYLLPSGMLPITGDFTINRGQVVTGQGQDFDQKATFISLGPTGRIVTQGYAALERVHLIQDASATVDALFAAGTATDTNAHNLTLRDLQFSGGNPAVWCIHYQNPYEFYWENIKANTSSNGILLEATNDHPYNPGDATAIKVQIRTRAPGTKCLWVRGQKAVDTTGFYGGSARYPNNITWVAFYASGADNPAWASLDMPGVVIDNCPRQHFYGANIEECNPSVALTGSINGGATTSTISFTDSWIASGGSAGTFVVNSGVTDVQFAGGKLDSEPSGVNAANVNLIGVRTGTGSSVPQVASPHYRGAIGSKTISHEIQVGNSSGADIGNSMVVKWDASGNVVPMTGSDNAAAFAGVTFSTIANGSTNSFVATAGNVPVHTKGVVSVGDYLVVDPANPGWLISTGTTASTTATTIGTAVTGGTNASVVVRLSPRPPIPAFASLGGGPFFGKSALYYSSGLNWTTAAMTANTLTAAPLYLPVSVTIDQLAVEVTTNATGAAIRLGIYGDNGVGYPGALVLDAGTVNAAASTGVQTIAVTQALSPGLYWLAAVAQGGAPSVRAISTPSYGIGYTALNNGVSAGYNHGVSVSGALPSTFSAASPSATGGVPRVAMRIA